MRSLVSLLTLLALLVLTGCSRMELVPPTDRVVAPVHFVDTPVEDIVQFLHEACDVDIIMVMAGTAESVTIVGESMTVGTLLDEIHRQTGLMTLVYAGTIYLGSGVADRRSVKLIDPAGVVDETTRQRLASIITVCSPDDILLEDMRSFVSRGWGLAVRYRGPGKPVIPGAFSFWDAPLYRVLNWWALCLGADLEVTPGTVTFIMPGT